MAAGLSITVHVATAPLERRARLAIALLPAVPGRWGRRMLLRWVLRAPIRLRVGDGPTTKHRLPVTVDA